MRKTLSGFVAVVLGVAVGGGVRGADYSVNGGILYYVPSAVVFGQYDVPTSPVSVGRGVNHDVVAVKDFHAQADSLAEEYGLHAHAFAQVTHNISGETGGGTYSATAFAKASFGDFVITGPAGATTVQTAVHLHMSGQQIQTSHTPAPGIGGGDGSSSVNFLIQVNGFSDGGSYALGFSRGVPRPVNETGMLIGFNGNKDLVTGVMTLPVNVPIPLALYLTAAADVTVDFQESFIQASNTDFSGTLTFATGRPVFDLPVGYTVNSVEGHVVNNTFTPVAVPEVGTMGVLVVGVVGVMRRRRGGAGEGRGKE